MKVENNLNQNYIKGNLSNNKVASQNFSGKGKAAEKVAETVDEFVSQSIPGYKGFDFLDRIIKPIKGELGGILITAIGTGAVAPFMIANNPFVKAKPDATEEEKQELENKKKYTAWRQPLSAVIAVLVQASALKPIDKFLDKMTNDPEFAKNMRLELDQSVLNKDSYLKRQVLNEMKNDVNTKSLSKEDFDKELKARISNKQKAQLEIIANGIENSQEIKIGERKFENKEVAEYFNKVVDSYKKQTEKIIEKVENSKEIVEAKLKDLEDCKLEISKEKAIETKDIKSAMEKLAKACDISGSENKAVFEEADEIFKHNKSELFKKISKNMAEVYKEVLGNRYKGFGQILKVAVGVLVTLPISCNLLNWVYPRFMDIFLPNIAGTKKPEAVQVKNGGEQ